MNDDPRVTALVDQVQAAANELLSHLPEDEIGIDEPFELALDAPIRDALAAVRTATSVYALMVGGFVLRYRPSALDGREEITAFRHREQIGRVEAPPHE